VITLPYLSAIRFSGADAGDFLHNQLSADVLALSDGESVFACYCEPKGRVLALMLVCLIDADYYVIMSNSLALTVSTRLKMYVMRSKVTIELLNENPIAGLEVDDQSITNSNSVCIIPLPDRNQRLALMNPGIMPETGTVRMNSWKISELTSGIVWLSPETSGQFLPQMLGFDQLGAVNFRKGCYPGQEIVARTHYLGKVKRHPRLLNLMAAPCPKPLEKIGILSDDRVYEAIIADCESDDEGTCLFVVTRMDPELAAEQVEYQGELLPLV
jgi:folate-binding protein YgfZ